MPNFSDRDLNDLLRVIDTNGNGVVEYEELLGDLGKTVVDAQSQETPGRRT